MDKKIRIFDNIQPFFKKNVDIHKILLSNKVFSSEKNYKYFIGYKDDYN